jgi:hypothetical protein
LGTKAHYADHKVKIWSTLPILDETADTEANPKLLCTMTTHSGKWNPVPRLSEGRKGRETNFRQDPSSQYAGPILVDF